VVPKLLPTRRILITCVLSCPCRAHRFAFLPLLYELVTGELKDWEVAPVFNDLLEGTGVKFVHGKVGSCGMQAA